MIAIDYSLFLDTFEDFQDILLPIIERQREAEGLPPIAKDDLMDYYLDLYNEHCRGKSRH